MPTCTLEVGRSYLLIDPELHPKTQWHARITINALDAHAPPNQLAVAYTYIEESGATGAGTMQLWYAMEFLVPVK